MRSLLNFLKTLLGNFVFELAVFGAIFGVLYLLFTTLRFDYAMIAGAALIVAVLAFLYWPRRK